MCFLVNHVKKPRLDFPLGTCLGDAAPDGQQPPGLYIRILTKPTQN